MQPNKSSDRTVGSLISYYNSDRINVSGITTNALLPSRITTNALLPSSDHIYLRVVLISTGLVYKKFTQ